MEEGKNYIELDNLYVYKMSYQYSQMSWVQSKKMSWQDKKIMGDQWISSADSVGANIAEGYGRFHFSDKNKFYYNARGSLCESQHWLRLISERQIIGKQFCKELNDLSNKILMALNSLIQSQLQQKNKSI